MALRQALMVGVRPLLVVNKPFLPVPLGIGNWKITVEKRNGTKVRVTVFNRVTVPGGTAAVPKVVELRDDEPLMLVGPVTVSAEVTEAGKEEYISVYATIVED